jgi:hypothetical protein
LVAGFNCLAIFIIDWKLLNFLYFIILESFLKVKRKLLKQPRNGQFLETGQDKKPMCGQLKKELKKEWNDLMNEKLQRAWEDSKKARSDADNLVKEADRFYEIYDAIPIEERQTAKNMWLFHHNELTVAKSKELYSISKLVFIKAVIEVYGDVEVAWNYDMAEVNGVVYK